MAHKGVAPWLHMDRPTRSRRLRTYRVNLRCPDVEVLPEDVLVAAGTIREALDLAAPQLGAPAHECFAVPEPDRAMADLGMSSDEEGVAEGAA